MLVDANLQLYAVDGASPHHAAAREWLESSMNGERRVGRAGRELPAGAEELEDSTLAAEIQALRARLDAS